MATSVSHTGSNVRDSYGGYWRLRSQMTRSGVDVDGNKSTVLYRAWMHMVSPNYVNNNTFTHYQTIDGVVVVNNVNINRSVSAGGETLVLSNSRTVGHNSSGNRSVYGYSKLHGSMHPTAAWSEVTLALDRINQFPNKPGLPTLTSSGLTVTVTSATAGGNGNAITSYRGRRRNAGTSTWTEFAMDLATRKATFTASGGTVEVQTRAATSRGAGPWSDTRSLLVGTAPSVIGSVTLTRNSRSLTAAWAAPNNGGVVISRYEAQLYDGLTWLPVRNTGNVLTTTYTGLLPGIAQKVRVRPVNSIGTAGWRESAAMIPLGCGCA